jgi:hypothetical protein
MLKRATLPASKDGRARLAMRGGADARAPPSETALERDDPIIF